METVSQQCLTVFYVASDDFIMMMMMMSQMNGCALLHVCIACCLHMMTGFLDFVPQICFQYWLVDGVPNFFTFHCFCFLYIFN